jgi:hypothetical protein
MALIYKMRAIAQSDSSYVFWTDSEPDLDGSNAPEAVVADSIVVDSVGGTAAGGASGEPTLIYEVDFASLAAQDLSTGGDGSKTIDGHTWYAWNTGTNNIKITNGTGIEIDGASVNAAYRTLVMDMSSLSDVDDEDDDLEMWFDVAYSGTPVDFHIFGTTMDQVWTSTPSRFPRPAYGWERSGGLRNTIYNLAGTNAFNSADAFAIANDRVFVVRGNRNIANLSAAVTADFNFWIGATTGTGWPSFSALKHAFTLSEQSLDYSGAWGPTFFSFDDPTTAGLTVKKMRILKHSQTL